MRTPARVQHAAFPAHGGLRGSGVVRPRIGANWDDFLQRLPAQFARYRALGIDYADSAFAVSVTAAAAAPKLASSSRIRRLPARSATPSMAASPTRESARYTAPLDLTAARDSHAPPLSSTASGCRIHRTRTFDRASLLRRNDDELKSCCEQAAAATRRRCARTRRASRVQRGHPRSVLDLGAGRPVAASPASRRRSARCRSTSRWARM